MFPLLRAPLVRLTNLPPAKILIVMVSSSRPGSPLSVATASNVAGWPVQRAAPTIATETGPVTCVAFAAGTDRRQVSEDHPRDELRYEHVVVAALPLDLQLQRT